MSILLDQSARVIVQGITGREGLFHTKNMLAAGTKVVGGVTPGRGGSEAEGLPVFDTVAQAKKQTGANASCIFVPAAGAADAIIGAMLSALAKAFIESDAQLAEINPLALTADGQVMAADAKILIDDNALPRQKEYAAWAEPEDANPIEYQAHEAGLASYVKLDGNVGIIANGAGLAMTTLDMVARTGGKPANFFDFGGGAKAELMKKALLFLASDPDVQGILVNIFGGITRGEEVARGVIMAKEELTRNLPIVVRLSGTGEAEGRAMLADAGLTWGYNMQDAAQKIVAAIKEQA